jgi:hypothetical protein
MNVERLSKNLRIKVGELNRGFYYEGLPEDIFREKLERVNSLLKSVRPHYQSMRERAERKEVLERMRRFMAYRRDDLDSGVSLVVILTKDDGSYDAIRGDEILDHTKVDKIAADEIVIVTNMKYANNAGFTNKTKGKTIDLCHVAARLFGKAMTTDDLAARLGIAVSPDRYKAVQQIAHKLISDFDEILEDAV